MSWSQGLQERKDLPEKFISIMEREFERRFGYHKDLAYITWFGLGDDVFIDFEDENCLKLDTRNLKNGLQHFL